MGTPDQDAPPPEVVEEVRTPLGRVFIIPEDTEYILIAQKKGRPATYIRYSVNLLRIPKILRSLAVYIETGDDFKERKALG